MSDQSAEFTLRDADNQWHDYRVKRPHRPIEKGKWMGGMRLMSHVARAAGTPIARMLNSNVGAIIETLLDSDIDAEGEVTAADLFAQIDTDDLSELDLELPSAFEAFCEAIDRIDPEDLFPQILHHTSRDGHPLSDQSNFNDAYEGNYMELLRAAFKVARINGFFGSLGTHIDDA